MSVVIRSKPSGILYLDIHYNGGRRRPSTGFQDTISNRKLLETEIIPIIELEIQKGTYIPKSQKIKEIVTVEEYGYISFKRNSDIRRVHVIRAIDNHFKKHIVPEFGKRLLSSITFVELLDWQTKKLETYSLATVKKFRSIFNTIFQDAFLENIINKNPFEQVRQPKKRDTCKESKINPFTLEEIKQLISCSKGYLKNFIAIMSFSGVRPGELVALKWKDVDFENEIFSINKTRIKNEDGPVKTNSSKRMVEMIGRVKDYFLNQYELTGKSETGYIFLNSSNKPFFNHDTIGLQFKKLLIKKMKDIYINYDILLLQ